MNEDRHCEEISEEVSKFLETWNANFLVGQFLTNLHMMLFQNVEGKDCANIFLNPLLNERLNNKILETIKSFFSVDELKKKFKRD